VVVAPGIAEYVDVHLGEHCVVMEPFRHHVPVKTTDLLSKGDWRLDMGEDLISYGSSARDDLLHQQATINVSANLATTLLTMTAPNGH
jgi:hypothetical protein